MHRYMNHLDDLAGLDIVFARRGEAQATVARRERTRQGWGARLVRWLSTIIRRTGP